MSALTPTTDNELTATLQASMRVAQGLPPVLTVVDGGASEAATQRPVFRTGTDLRNSDGYYCHPHPSLLKPGEEPEYFPAVSTFLRNVSSEPMRRAEQYFAAEECASHAALLRYAIENAKSRGEVVDACVGVYDKTFGCMIDRPILDVLQDSQWMSMAGPRGMTRRAHRGTIMHDAQEEWAKGCMMGRRDVLRWDDKYLPDWVATARSANDYAAPAASEVLPYVIALLKYLDRHVVSVKRAECAVFNRSLVYAGTLDMDGVEIDGHDGLFLWDAKSRGSITPRVTDLLALLSYQHAEYYADPMTGLLVPFKAAPRIANLFVAPDDRKDAEPNTCRAELRIWQDCEYFTLMQAWQEVMRLRESWQVQHQLERALCGMAPIVKAPKSSLAVDPPRKRGPKATPAEVAPA